ncbi:hypothetical protein JCGZ_26500 [Jatropha curcas]|uniref:Uncharacterized protein n=1 Tax=Jatropha curcas TaxID=180498 RepID=A0A067JL57_JATCU|nr:hypothetical protein JCGZ_26500 [Jatropha curcas]
MAQAIAARHSPRMPNHQLSLQAQFGPKARLLRPTLILNRQPINDYSPKQGQHTTGYSNPKWSTPEAILCGTSHFASPRPKGKPPEMEHYQLKVAARRKISTKVIKSHPDAIRPPSNATTGIG